MKIGWLRVIALLLLTILTILISFFMWRIIHFQIGSDNVDNLNVFINKYSIQRNQLWDSILIDQHDFKNKIQFHQSENGLIIEQKYMAAFQEGIIEDKIASIIKLRANISNIQKSQTDHFVIQREKFQQIYYYSKSLNSLKNSNSQYKVLKSCVNLDEVNLKDKLQYFVDLNGKLWIVSHPHNNVLFVQIYDCEKGKILKKIIHQPKNNQKAFMINQIKFILDDSISRLCSISLLTYQAHQYILQINIDKYQIEETLINYSHKITFSRISIEASQSIDNIKYELIDPLNNIFKEQFQQLLLTTVKKYIVQIKSLLSMFKVEVKWLIGYLNSRLKQIATPKQPDYLDYDVQAFDYENNCLINFKYNDKEESQTSLLKLGKYLINAKTAVFHNNAEYDQNDVIEILKKERQPQLSQFKRINMSNGHLNEYHSDYFFSLFKVQPNNNIHFMGIGQKLLYFHPQQALNQEDYIHIRSKTGGVVLQGNKVKGAYEDQPQKEVQIAQKYYIKANQVLTGVFEAHISFRSLYSVLKNNKVELINGMNGKAALTYYLNQKEGYSYGGSYLFNNQWWIIQHNYQIHQSYLVKHQLYVDSQHPKQLISVKRIYGKFFNSEFQKQQDDIGQILFQFNNKYQTGFVILDIFRCIDEYYYIQVADPLGKHLLIARVHFKRLSNRQPKISLKYSGQLQEDLIVQPKDMIKQTQKIEPFGLVLENSNLLSNIQDLLKNQRIYQWINYVSTNKRSSYLTKLNQFQMLPYSIFSSQNIDKKNKVKQTLKQEIQMLNMRTSVQNAKKQVVFQSRISAKNSLLLFLVCILLILLCSITKLILAGKQSNVMVEKEIILQKTSSAQKQSKKGNDKKAGKKHNKSE